LRDGFKCSSVAGIGGGKVLNSGAQ
jgi:hypothetical protein